MIFACPCCIYYSRWLCRSAVCMKANPADSNLITMYLLVTRACWLGACHWPCFSNRFAVNDRSCHCQLVLLRGYSVYIQMPGMLQSQRQNEHISLVCMYVWHTIERSNRIKTLYEVRERSMEAWHVSHNGQWGQ